jgi:hypothetical protein
MSIVGVVVVVAAVVEEAERTEKECEEDSLVEEDVRVQLCVVYAGMIV